MHLISVLLPYCDLLLTQDRESIVALISALVQPTGKLN
jgi:hypothetical protein